MLKTYFVKPSIRHKSLNPDDDILSKRKEIRSIIPAVTHVDYSARVQTVSKIFNPFIHAILVKYHNLTQVGVLVNTSFNLRGEPIVNTATQALECFLFSDIDVLILENYLIRKTNQKKESLLPKRAPALKED
jgi:carbamoyltransferase